MPDPSYAPGFLRFRYSGVNRPHTQKQGIKFVGTPAPGNEPDFEQTGGGSINMSAAIVEWMLVQQTCFNAVTTFGFVDCYAVDATTGFQTFIWTINAGYVGTSVEDRVPMSEGVFVFKTSNGKPLKIYQMEGVWNTDIRNIGTVPADGRQNVLDYILGTTNIFYGLKNAFPLAFMSFTSKENDILRRQQMPTV